MINIDIILIHERFPEIFEVFPHIFFQLLRYGSHVNLILISTCGIIGRCGLNPLLFSCLSFNCKYYNLHVHMDNFKMILVEENIDISGPLLTAYVFQYYDEIINIPTRRNGAVLNDLNVLLYYYFLYQY